tara:strand:- start:582 stop:1616 length:1035 start_codon:yes stop_codon:yes gene_type:complete
MSVKFSNNGHSTLASSLTNSATSITVASGHGARFPSLSSGEYFYATLIDSSNNLEIVKVTARSSDVLTATRAQESTTGIAFAAGDRIELRVTAQGLVDVGTLDDDAVVTAKVADTAITGAKLNNDVISAQTALTAQPADTDEFMVSDAGVIKRIDYSLIKATSGVVQIKNFHYTNGQTIQSQSYTDTNILVAITPTAADSSFYVHAVIAAGMINHDSSAVFNVHDSQLGNSFSTTGQHIFSHTHHLSGQSSTNVGYMSNHWGTGSDGSPDDYRGANSSHVFGMYTPSSNNANARTFTVVCRTHRDTQNNGIRINDRGSQQNDHGHQSAASSYIMVWEIANGIFS